MSGPGALSPTRSLVEGVGRSDLKEAYGQVTPAVASATVVTGLAYVSSVVVTLDGDPAAGVGDVAYVTASTGDQAGTPAAGSFLLKSWQDDFVTAATTNWLKVNWRAMGY